MTTEKTVTVVINNREGIEMCQLPHRKVPMADPRLPPRLILSDSVNFLPGLNFVDTDVLDELCENPSFLSKFKTKIPPSLAPEQSPEKVGQTSLVRGKALPAERPMSKLSDAEVIALVGEMNDLQLEQFLVEEKHRQPVREAIEARIKKIADAMEQAGAF